MKCPKCGYMSFDYLSACKRCLGDLTQVRVKLGFTDFRPTGFVYLGGGSAGSLDIPEPVRGDADTGVLETSLLPPAPELPVELKLDSTHTGSPREGESFADLPAVELDEIYPLPPAEPVVQSAPAEVFDLELDMDMDLPLENEGLPVEPSEKLNVQSPELIHLDDEDTDTEIPTIELTDDDLEGLLETLKIEPVVQQAKAFPVTEPIPVNSIIQGSSSCNPTINAPDPDSEFVIELSDDDIDSILLELGETAPGPDEQQVGSPQKYQDEKYRK